MLEEELGLLVRFPYFKHFEKAVIGDSCNTASGPKISLINKYPFAYLTVY